MRGAFRFVFYVLFILFGLSLWGYYAATHPYRIYTDDSPKNYQLKYDTVTLTTKDNVELSAWYIPAKIKTNKAIVLLHGYGADKANVLASRIFLQANYNLLFLDFRYFGKSKGSYSTAGLYEVQDLDAAVTYLKEHGMKKIGVWGLSMGAAVAIMSAEHNPGINAIVAESPYASLQAMANDYYKIPFANYVLGRLMRLWGMLFLGEDLDQVNPAESIKTISIPILLLHSSTDWQTPLSHALRLQDAAKHNPNFELQIRDDVPHGGIDQKMQRKIDDFFSKSL